RPGLQREPSRLPVAVAMPDWRVDPVAPLVPPPPERLGHLLLQHRLHELLDLHPHPRLQRLPHRPGALPLLSATPPHGRLSFHPDYPGLGFAAGRLRRPILFYTPADLSPDGIKNPPARGFGHRTAQGTRGSRRRSSSIRRAFR